jgi:hypothetical protein
MAVTTLFAEPALMVVIIFVAGDALFFCFSVKPVFLVAVSALQGIVLAFQAEFCLFIVIKCGLPPPFIVMA